MRTQGRAVACGAGRCAATLLLTAGLAGCAAEAGFGPAAQFAAMNHRATGHVTGEVEIVWPGGKGKEIAPGEEKLAFAEFEAFPETDNKLARGTFIYRVLNADGTPHREITASVTGAFVDPVTSKAWFVGLVESDVKVCSGGGGSCDGHDGGTHDDGGCSHDDGGCSHDDGTTDDGGCSHDDGTTEDGGCSHDDGTTPDDGGCTHDDGTTDDGGCSHDDGTTHDEGGCGGGGGEPGGGGHGEPGGGGHGSVPGKNPRVGQIVAVKAHDVATPGADGDGVTWKWFAAESWQWFEDAEQQRPTLGPLAGPEAEKAGPTEWPHLCKKTIIGGNLVVHLPQ